MVDYITLLNATALSVAVTGLLMFFVLYQRRRQEIVIDRLASSIRTQAAQTKESIYGASEATLGKRFLVVRYAIEIESLLMDAAFERYPLETRALNKRELTMRGIVRVFASDPKMTPTLRGSILQVWKMRSAIVNGEDYRDSEVAETLELAREVLAILRRDYGYARH